MFIPEKVFTISTRIANTKENKGFLHSTKRSTPLKVSIVVPCYNEAERLSCGDFLNFLMTHSEYQFIFVDDGSKDGTHTLLQAMKSTNPYQVEVLRLEKNSGKAEAVRQGLLYATKQGTTLVGYWDADLATPLETVEDFVKIAHNYDGIDVIYGARLQILGHRISRTFQRRVISKICNMLARVAVRLPINDTQCGAKLFRNTSVFRKSINKKFTTGWLFDVELFSRLSVQLKGKKTAFYEFPLSEWAEIAGSKVSRSVIIKSGFSMLGLIAKSRRYSFALSAQS